MRYDTLSAEAQEYVRGYFGVPEDDLRPLGMQTQEMGLRGCDVILVLLRADYRDDVLKLTKIAVTYCPPDPQINGFLTANRWKQPFRGATMESAA